MIYFGIELTCLYLDLSRDDAELSAVSDSEPEDSMDMSNINDLLYGPDQGQK